MVGREKEMDRLVGAIERAERGEGSLTLVSGEAGVGKTRLVEEVSRVARFRGFMVLSSNAVYESLSPYLPFVEALMSGELEHLFVEEPPRVESVMLVTHSGILVDVVTRERTELDPDIFASMLNTVGNFVRDTLSLLSGEERGGMLNTLGYERYRIVIEGGEALSLVLVLSGKENEHLLRDARELLSKVERRFGTVVRDWNGDEARVEGIGGLLGPLITSGKYDGVSSDVEDPRSRRELLFENVAMGLARVSASRPVLLCIEDLQWADPSTLALFHYVSIRTRGSPIAMLGTYRPEDVTPTRDEPHPLVRTLDMMGREDLCDELHISRLPESAVRDFIVELLGPPEPEGPLVKMTYTETEGNPLFMVQLLGLMVEEGRIGTSGDSWVMDRTLGDMDIPSKVHHVISMRLERVPREHRRLLDHASVIGVTFSPSLLALTMEEDGERVLEELRDIGTRHLLIRPVDGEFRFDHTKIKEVLYDLIPGDLREGYHAKVAAAMERTWSDDPSPVVEDLAFHYSRSSNERKAVDYLLAAAEKAKRQFSNDEAVRFYALAKESIREPEQRLMVLEELGQLYDFLGRYIDSLRSYEDAMEQTSDNRRRAGLHARIGSTYAHMEEYDKGLEVCERALALLGDEDCSEKGLVHGIMGILYERKREYGLALQHLGQVSRHRRGE